MPAKSINKLLPTETELLPDARRVRVICSTETVDRMGDVVVQSGIDLVAYRKNPVVLWGHDSDVPVAKAIEIGIDGGKLKAMVEFPVEGADSDADRVYAKIKAGIINATSVGFVPLEWEAIDPKEPWGGLRFSKSELLEFSFVSIPANKECLIVGRSVFIADKSAADKAVVSPEEWARALALPQLFRDLAKKLPASAKGQRGQLLRCANIAAREIRGAVEKTIPELEELKARIAKLRAT